MTNYINRTLEFTIDRKKETERERTNEVRMFVQTVEEGEVITMESKRIDAVKHYYLPIVWMSKQSRLISTYIAGKNIHNDFCDF